MQDATILVRISEGVMIQIFDACFLGRMGRERAGILLARKKKSWKKLEWADRILGIGRNMEGRKKT